MKLRNIAEAMQHKHIVASFTNQENSEVYWADRCSCGSKTDDENKCLALKEEKNAN